MADADSTRLWRPVLGFDGYEVSNDGMVRSWRPERNFGKRPLAPRLLCANRDADGYTKAVLYINGKRHDKRVATLVAEAFVGPRPDGMVVRHVDGDRSNDRAGNLLWGTPKENSEDAKRHGTWVHGTKVNTAKLTEADVVAILKSREPHAALAKRYGVSPCAIWHIRAGRTWKHVSRTESI